MSGCVAARYAFRPARINACGGGSAPCSGGCAQPCRGGRRVFRGQERTCRRDSAAAGAVLVVVGAERTSFVGQVQAEPGQLQAQSGMVLDRTFGDGSIMPGREEAVVACRAAISSGCSVPTPAADAEDSGNRRGTHAAAADSRNGWGNGESRQGFPQRAEIVAVSSPSRSHRSRGRSRPNRGRGGSTGSWPE